MKPIRKRFSRPYLLLIIAMPVAILLLFNGIVARYSRERGEEDLLSAVDFVKESIGSGNAQTMLDLLRNQSPTVATELLVYNRLGNLSELFNRRTDSFVTDEIARLVYAQTETLPFYEIGSFRYEGDTYHAVKVEFESQTQASRVVYISKGLALDAFVNTVNIVLLAVSGVITLIALFVSTRVTNAIVKPIEHLTARIERMNTDERLVIDDRSDVLELHKLTAEINALNKRIYHYNASQKSFLHNASHELRTPLMSIQGYADGIEMGVFEDYRGTAHLISDQSKRLTKLVDSLLTLARAENFNANQKLEQINLSEGLFEMLDAYRGYALSQNIDIETTLQPHIVVLAHSELLSNSVGNVVSNAIRYAQTTVNITLTQEGETAVLRIHDDGDGIQNVDTIFDRFSKGTDGNFGLGLSIAKTAVHIMNGSITVRNENGAVFEFRIPTIPR